MPYAFQLDIPTDEQFYEKVKAEIGDEQPQGLISHLVVKQDGGLRHIDVWESKEDWDRFSAERVGPAVGKLLRASGATDLPPAPVEQELDVVDTWIGA